MRLSKKAIEDIVNRLYTIEQNGEKVIRPDRLKELTDVILIQFKNVYCGVERGFGGEKLVVSSISKSGTRKMFERKIGYDINLIKQEEINTIKYSDSPWHIKEIIDIFSAAIESYGYDVFRDRTKSAAFCTDILAKYPDECRVIKMIFNEGIYEVLGNVPLDLIEEANNAFLRMGMFLDKLGFTSSVKSNIQEILINVFTEKKVFQLKGKSIDVSNTLDVPGHVFYVSDENSTERKVSIFDIEATVQPGMGIFEKEGIRNYTKAMNETSDAYQYLKQHSSEISKETNFLNFDYSLKYQNCLSSNMPNKVKKILMPIMSVTEISDIPTEILASFVLIFYSTPSDAVVRALDLK